MKPKKVTIHDLDGKPIRGWQWKVGRKTRRIGILNPEDGTIIIVAMSGNRQQFLRLTFKSARLLGHLLSDFNYFQHPAGETKKPKTKKDKTK